MFKFIRRWIRNISRKKMIDRILKHEVTVFDIRITNNVNEKGILMHCYQFDELIDKYWPKAVPGVMAIQIPVKYRYYCKYALVVNSKFMLAYDPNTQGAVAHAMCLPMIKLLEEIKTGDYITEQLLDTRHYVASIDSTNIPHLLVGLKIKVEQMKCMTPRCDTFEEMWKNRLEDIVFLCSERHIRDTVVTTAEATIVTPNHIQFPKSKTTEG